MKNKVLSSALQNWIPKIFSFLIALFIVLSIRFMNVNDRVVTLPLEVILPEDFNAVSLVPETVDVVITGSDSIIYLVDPSGITAKADFSSVSAPGIERVPVMLEYRDDIYTRDGLVVSASPSSVRILFEGK
ncbi:MAG: hypothetical protein IAA97_06005 [Spirochaetes bacterium]|uniref:YbbR-like domain-containing protein n=1 Tax=Candidatus Ornithospirochaeta stercoripullorum TaxID=2840899 RepID=A0A9D9E3N9_9SPIO|nr:hypothetical protein [Candidatus Ornithospirochaeta stercoripullorum]